MANCNKLFLVFGLSVLCLMRTIGATVFTVGGSNGWTLPTSSLTYNQWAERNRFQVGDSLLFMYNADKDSVLQVTKEDYEKCNTSKPLETFRDGNNTVMFYVSGPHYYISGNRENCLQNEKMVVTVMAFRGGSSNGATSSRFSCCIGAIVASLFLLVQIG